MKRLLGWHRDQSGQTLVLFVLGLGVLLGMMAMAIDVGLYLQERRSLQNAADAAALAGVAELPDDPSVAIAKAYEWVGNNGFDSGSAVITATAPYSGNSSSIEVEIGRWTSPGCSPASSARTAPRSAPAP